MKRIILAIILLLSACNWMPHVDTGLIVFSHEGPINYIPIPLYISTKKLNIKLDDDQFAQLKLITHNPYLQNTPENEKRYLDAYYSIVVTDKNTFSNIYQFIYTHKDYYTNSENRNDMRVFESFDINVNGVKFAIYYKLKEKFFFELKRYLREQECDGKVIKALSNLAWDGQPAELPFP
jgi:hypothetical protein